MRQSRPRVIFAVECRRNRHLLCSHGYELESAQTRYVNLCACDCHPRRPDDPPELLALRHQLAQAEIISGQFDPTLPPLPDDMDTPAGAAGCRRFNPLAELAPQAARPSSQKQQVLLGDRSPAAPLDKLSSILATSVAVDPKDTAKARTCDSCHQKRQVIRWTRQEYWSKKTVARFQLCAPCLLEALSLLLTKNITRQKPEKGETPDEIGTRTPDVETAFLHRAKTRGTVQRQRRGSGIRRADRKRQRRRNKRKIR